jgi:hypothetical protein
MIQKDGGMGKQASIETEEEDEEEDEEGLDDHEDRLAMENMWVISDH